MMRHLSITALTCSALIALTNPVKAEEWSWNFSDVYYCESESGAFVQEEKDWKFTKWTPQRFKFKIERIGDYRYLKFGKGGYLDKTTLDISDINFEGDSYLSAGNFGRNFLLNGGRFKYVELNAWLASMMTGTCDKF